MLKKRKKRPTRKHFISLIIPTYKHEKTIKKDLIRIKKAMDQLRHGYEMIIVVDGIVDKTIQRAREVKSRKIKITGYNNNHGKGYAIRYGMARAKGDIVAFLDSGMDINPNGISMLLEHFEWYDAHIIVGSKRHPVSKVSYPLVRKIISYLSQWYIRFLFGLNVRDTQVGIKFFRREVLEKVLPRLLVKRYAFDIELLVVANYLGFRRIFEAPVEIQWGEGSGITSRSLWKVLLLTFIDTLAIFYRLNLLQYYNDGNRVKWKYDPELDFRVNLP